MRAHPVADTMHMSKIAFVAVLASSFVLAGCPRTVTAPAAELPNIAPGTVDRSERWPVVMTTSGEAQSLQGPIEQITIKHARGSETIGTHFDAIVVGNDLNVINWQGPRVYPLAEKPIIIVDYSDRKTASVIGGVALGLGGVPLSILGIAAMAEGASIRGSGGFDTLGKLILVTFGAVITISGLTMIGSGIYLAARTPKKPKSDLATNLPSLHIGPTGAGMTVKF